MDKQKSKSLSRRQFIKTSAALGAFSIVPSSVIAGNGKTPPSEKVNIAVVGSGNRGKRHIEWTRETENIVALCDVDWVNAAESFKLAPNAKKYHDYRKMLEKEDKNIDAVMIATPDHTHAVIAMAAMDAFGNH